MKVHLGSDFPRAVHLLLLGESGDGGPAQRGQLGEQRQDKKSKLDTGEMNIMHMVVWMNTAGATGKVTQAQVTRKFQGKKAQQAAVNRLTKICPEEGALRHQGQGVGDAGVI